MEILVCPDCGAIKSRCYWYTNRNREQPKVCLDCHLKQYITPEYRKRRSEAIRIRGYAFPANNRLLASHPREKNPKWKGGISILSVLIRQTCNYKDWRTLIHIRDRNRCQKCDRYSRDNEVHHKKPFATILIENSITTIEKALECRELWDTNNGIVLCKDCHKETNSYKRNL